MKNYRIIQRGLNNFIVQRRFWFFFWRTLQARFQNTLGLHDKEFNDIMEAREYIRKQKIYDSFSRYKNKIIEYQ